MQPKFRNLLEDLEKMDNITILPINEDEFKITEEFTRDIGTVVTEKEYQKKRELKVANRI